MTVDSRSQQENAALILLAQVDAASLLRQADRATADRATTIVVSVDEARLIAKRIESVADIAERAHLGQYGFSGVHRRG